MTMKADMPRLSQRSMKTKRDELIKRVHCGIVLSGTTLQVFVWFLGDYSTALNAEKRQSAANTWLVS